ncbi:hypothetical protein MKEN_00295900 [Mycena kentingensis (nom. inval.)]|nr:hypothetical protein MKEN_00295900 [Mycena kentingensis (nom. inval.)]
MNAHLIRARAGKVLAALPARLYRALPAVILGTIMNALDTVSSGVLIFPSEDAAFHSLQLQGLSMFLMSNVLGQLVMTLGGSRFPGGFCAMLIEILPFLRGIATDIHAALGGGDHPALIPTVMAAYALTSFLTGMGFLLLGLFKIGNLVAYFPHTVLTGAIGAIGLSLCILGLEIPIPLSAEPLTLRNAATRLFSPTHIGILAASAIPALLLSVALRARSVEVATRGRVRSAYCVPLYLLVIPVVFWAVVAARRIPMRELAELGWLFTVEKTVEPDVLVAGWNYWALYDFTLVEWWTLKSATKNIVLLVVIGILNLPIYVPTLAFTLDCSYDMNYELLGQGLGNIVSGIAGSVPNLIQYSYSVYITRANGGRFELFLVCILSSAFFLTAGLILPYIPTILGSTLVLFIGTELFLEAVWEAAKTLAWMEYAVVLATLGACTALGFAEGFGVGIAAAAAVYLVYGVVDSRARVVRWAEWNEMQHFKEETRAEGESGHVLGGRLPSRQNYMPERISLDGAGVETEEVALPLPVEAKLDADVLQKLNARVLALPGYVFFASIPSIERALLSPSNSGYQFHILDLSRTHRIETTAARALLRCFRELPPRSAVLCGVIDGSGLAADLARAEVGVCFASADGAVLPVGPAENETEQKERALVPAFATRDACLSWCRAEHDRRASGSDKRENTPSEARLAMLDDDEKAEAYAKFCSLFGFDAITVFENDDAPADGGEVQRFVDAGGRFQILLPGQSVRVDGQGPVFVIEGTIALSELQGSAIPVITRPSVHAQIANLPRDMLRAARERMPAVRAIVGLWRRSRSDATFVAGQVLDAEAGDGVVVGKTRAIVMRIVGEGSLTRWAAARANAALDA